MNFTTIITALSLLCLSSVNAQLPSECLLIINESSERAKALGERYAELRNFPEQRILRLQPPEQIYTTEDGTPRWNIAAMELAPQLLEPVQAKLLELLDPSPTAFILSPDWPTHVVVPGHPPMSVTAWLGCLGEAPEAAKIKSGQERSPWFTHPEEQAKGRRLQRYPAAHLSGEGFHPAMILGVYYQPLQEEQLNKAIQRSVKADFSRPNGSVAIITNKDVRTRARLKQFLPAAEALEAKGQDVVIAPRSEALPRKLIGVMTGAASVPIERYQGKLQPGSFAEHLTSFAATFHIDSQTKMTGWIEAGAAGTMGTVNEPFAIWSKFPHTALFERYLDGNTLLEAIHQSVMSPYQSLAMGDPLCRPWGEKLKGLKLSSRREQDLLIVEAKGAPVGGGVDLHLFYNGLRVPREGPLWHLDLSELSEGTEIRLQLHARKLWAPPRIGYAETRLTW